MGLTKKKAEGDLKTPRGSFNFSYLMYRSDRISNIQTKLKKIKIKKKFGWCDDASSNDYNKLIKFPFKKKAESLPLLKNFNRQALHAFQLGFKHPRINKNLYFETKLPNDMENLINSLESF